LAISQKQFLKKLDKKALENY